MLFKTLSTVLVAASAAMAANIPRALPSGTVTCGSNKYSVSAITAAINGGVKDLDDGNLPGALIRSLEPSKVHVLIARL